MAFGTHTMPKIWCILFGLVMWITIYIYLCLDLMHYMDDSCSYEMDPVLVYYKPYDTWYPKKQVTLLLLHNELGLPHIKKNNYSVTHSTSSVYMSTQSK